MPTTIQTDERVFAQLPLPLAQLYRRSLNAKTPLERHQAAYFLWEAALKLTGATAIVAYSVCENHQEQLTERLRRLARPSLGNWWEFVRTLVPHVAETGDDDMREVRDALLGKARHDLPRASGLDATLLETLDGRKGARSTVRLTELFDRLVQYRNQELGHGAAGQRSADHYDAMGRALLAGVGEILERVDPLVGRSLVYVSDVRRQASGNWLVERFALAGETPRRLESLEFAATDLQRLPRPETVYLESGGESNDSTDLQSLHPLVLYDAEANEFFFLNARRKRSEVEYLCYTTGRVMKRDALVTEHEELLARLLGVEVNSTTKQQWAAESLSADSSVSSEEPEPESRTIGEFEILSRIDRGGMGVVYRAWQPSLGRQVALKCLLRSGDPKAEARFAREIRALGRVEHPNLVKIFTSGSQGDDWFYTMELVEGANLAGICDHLVKNKKDEVGPKEWRRALTKACEAARAKEEPVGNTAETTTQFQLQTQVADVPQESPNIPLAPEEEGAPSASRGHVEHAVNLIRQVAEAAHALHQADIVHRDIKPGNVVVTPDGSHAVLMDLGLAHLTDDAEGRLTRTRQFVGTLRYASPEQLLAAGAIDRRSDVYSLGATLWELLTLRPMFGANAETPTPDLMVRIQSSEPQRPRKLNRNVPVDLEAIVLKCLEKDPERRYQTAKELADDLGRWQRGEPVSAQPPTVRYILGKYIRRHRVKIAAISAVLALAFTGLMYGVYRIDQSRRDAQSAREDAVEQRNLAVNARDRANSARTAAERNLYAVRMNLAQRALQEKDVVRAGVLLKPYESPEYKNLAGFEYQLYRHWLQKHRPALTEHKDRVDAVAFSPGGGVLASGDERGNVVLADPNTGRVIKRLRADHSIDDLWFAGKVRLIAAGDSGRLTVWNTATFEAEKPIESQLSAVTFLKGSEKSQTLVAGSPRDGLEVWNLAERKRVKQIPFDKLAITAFDVSVNRGFAVAADRDGHVHRWDLVTGDHTKLSIRYTASRIEHVSVSADGAVLVLGSVDGLLTVWDLTMPQQTKPIATVDEQLPKITAMTFLPFSYERWKAGSLEYLAVARTDGTMRFRSLVVDVDPKTSARSVSYTGIRFMFRGKPVPIAAIAFNHQGSRIASSDIHGRVRIWDSLVGSAKPFGSIAPATFPVDDIAAIFVAWHPKKPLVAVTTGNDAISIWNTETQKRVAHVEPNEKRPWIVRYSPDGALLASGYVSGTAEIRDAGSLKVQFKTKLPSEEIWDLAFTPDHSSVFIAGSKGTVMRWEFRTGKTREFSPPSAKSQFDARDGIWGLAVSPDGKLLATTSSSHDVNLWDVETGKLIGKLEGHKDIITCVAFSPDGKTIASGSRDSTVRLWNVKARTPLKVLRGHSSLIFRIAFDPSGRTLASASMDSTVRLWNVSTGLSVGTLTDHTRYSYGVAFSPDGRSLASTCMDGKLRIWRAK